MKRKVLSLVITLALCLNICPAWAFAAGTRDGTGTAPYRFTLTSDLSWDAPYVAAKPTVFDTGEYTFTGTGSSAIQVTGTGELYLKGNVAAETGSGVEVQSGGSLTITEPGTAVNAETYALDIASGATVRLFAGTYYGYDAAIRVEGNDFAGLLAEGCAYFNKGADGKASQPLRPAEVPGLGRRDVLGVGPCTDHLQEGYTPAAGAASHTWTCAYCASEQSEPCTFTFGGAETKACDHACGNALTVAVDTDALAELVYDGTVKPKDGAVTVTLNSGTPLAEGTDYTAAFATNKDAGEVTVTVTGVTFGGTFVKTYEVTRTQPVLAWNAGTQVVNYDGEPVEAGDLPPVTIHITTTEDLKSRLQYSYKKAGDSAYTSGLPTNAGTYEVIASLPEMENFAGAVTAPLTLTINKINPIGTAPAAKTLTFNRTAQELTTPGTLNSVAERDGVNILFSTSQNGTYSETIPTGTKAGNYEVWYKVESTENYIAAGPARINVTIEPKAITPAITVTEPSYVFDNSKKQPVITVKDVDTVIDASQYTVTWTGKTNQAADGILRDVGTYTAAIKNIANGNYTFTATVPVEIVAADQNALTITGKRDPVYYGDVFTLGTTGGTGNGTVAWSVTSGNGTASINPTTGELTVNDIGAVTVKAERTVENYGKVSDTWTFTAQPKPVVAEVTVTPKPYDGTTTASVTAAVKASDLVNGDTVTLSGLTGAYDDANVGTNKTVTLNDTNAVNNSGKYAVSYPAAVKGDITRRNVSVTVTLSGNGLTASGGSYSYVYDGKEKTPAVTVTGSDAGGYSAALAESDYEVRCSNNLNVGTAAVTVTAKTDGNYTFAEKTVNFTIEKASAVLTSTPQAKDLTYIKDTKQDLVTIGAADGGTVVYSKTETGPYSAAIPQKTGAGTYTVYYKVQGDANHSDTAPGQVSVTIKPKEFTPVIELSEKSFAYDGTEKKPSTVTVKDGTDVISDSEYTVSYRDNINAGTAAAVISDNNGGNYIVNGTAAFQITKAGAAFTRVPAGKTGLEYTGAAQELVTEGVTSHGAVVYSLDGGNYSPTLPTASAVKAYSIHYMIRGDANHNDTDPAELTVSIGKNTVNDPVISLSSDTFKYTGAQQQPVVTVYDKSGRVIPEHEYTVTVTGTKSNNMVDVDTYTVAVTTPDTSNYHITGVSTKTFAIVPADQETISITGAKGQVYYGDVIQLDATGGTGGGTVTWTVTGNTGTTLTPAGLLTVKDVGTSITVTATRSRGDNYSDISATWTFTAARKPVTAVLTGVDKNYDGTVSAAIKAEVSASGLVSGDTVTIPNLSGTFDNANVGTNKTVTRTGSAPTATGTNADKYDITYPAATTASIRAVTATVGTAPTVNTLTYVAGKAQALVTAGTGTGGEMVYSLDGVNYTQTIPTAKDAGEYTVYYKVRGDQNHTDSAAVTMNVTINRQNVTPSIELTPPNAQYDGQVHRPAVTARDTAHNVIPAGEYTVTYVTDSGENWRDKGSYQVRIEDISGGNYAVGTVVEPFEISEAAQSPLTITGRPGRVQYGDAPFVLSAVGGSGTGAITWSSSDANIAEVDGNGRVTVKQSGEATITATRAADANYSAVSVDWTFTVEQKPAEPTLNLASGPFVYTSNPITPRETVVVEGKTLGAGEYAVAYSNNVNAGAASVSVTSTSACNYQFSGTVQFQIAKAQAEYATEPNGKTGLTYNGSNQALVTAGAANFGTIEYSLSQDSGYSADISTIIGANAGEYTVFYKVEDTDNYTGIEEKSIKVTIGKATPTITDPTASGTAGQMLSELTQNFTADVAGNFAWANSDTKPDVGETSHSVTFTPDDGLNYNTVTFNVTVTISAVPVPGGSNPSADISSIPSTNAVSMSMPASVKDGTASAAVTAAAGSRLVKAAAANQSSSVVIKPEIGGSVSKAEVSIPASTVKQLRDETGAALTVSTPIADATIPQEALDTLGRAGGSVSVAAEQVDQGVALTLTAGGRKVDSVPGGLTLTVPAEDTGPGTVAVLVHEDGTRETVRKSIAGDGKVDIPLSGSATVEIVDNSKEFSDVPPTSWEADAVAFASAHELFNGTSETTFSPEEPMSRGMLATVLYNLEGRPEQDLTMQDLAGGYSDVSGDAWYADGVAWAAEKGIVNGYGNGEFGPGDSVTREQLAVMLWKYAGSPSASSQALSFTDADLASDYAQEALRWAVEKGIMNGYGDGRLAPRGTATRAEAAQMLKNFMECA